MKFNANTGFTVGEFLEASKVYAKIIDETTFTFNPEYLEKMRQSGISGQKAGEQLRNTIIKKTK